MHPQYFHIITTNSLPKYQSTILYCNMKHLLWQMTVSWRNVIYLLQTVKWLFLCVELVLFFLQMYEVFSLKTVFPKYVLCHCTLASNFNFLFSFSDAVTRSPGQSELIHMLVCSSPLCCVLKVFRTHPPFDCPLHICVFLYLVLFRQVNSVS